MDVTPYLELKPAPFAVFDHLDERRDRARFMLPDGEGGWQPVTWQQYADGIRYAARWLAANGLESEDRAAIFAPNRVEWAEAALAIQAAGGAMVPVYGSSTAEQAGYVIQHSDARFVFVDTEALLERVLHAWPSLEQVERLVLLDPSLDAEAVAKRARDDGAPVEPSEVADRIVGWDRLQQEGGRLHREAPSAFDRMLEGVSLDQMGLMLYTSGTSGPPKGVPLTHRNVASNGRDWLEANAPLLDEGAVDLHWLPMSHIFGFGEITLGNSLGFETWMSTPQDVLRHLPEVRPTVFMSVPAYWEKIAQAAADAPDVETRQRRLDEVTGGRLRFCLSGGAGLKREVKEMLHEHGILVIEGYGLTETAPTLTLNRPDAFRFDSVGKPLPSVELRLAPAASEGREEGDEAEEGGEILARGPNVFGGYHKNPEATREAFTEDGWLKTGDLGAFTEDGFLQIIGRKKDILVTAGGKNIAPDEIEQRFADDPLIAHVLVYGDGKRYLVAGIWLEPVAVQQWLADQGVSGAERERALESYVRERVDEVNGQLARHQTIKRWRIVEQPLTIEAGHLTPTFKVKRRKVEEAFRDELEALYED